MGTFLPGPFFQLLLLAAFVLPAVLFLLTQQSTLSRIKPENRRLLPGLVWLQIIPVLGQLWQFVVIVMLSGSLRKEVMSWYDDPLFGPDAAKVELGNKRPTLWIGLTYSILQWSTFLISFGGESVRRASDGLKSDTFDLILGLVAFCTVICWIVYWVTLAVWKRRLKERFRFTI